MIKIKTYSIRGMEVLKSRGANVEKIGEGEFAISFNANGLDTMRTQMAQQEISIPKHQPRADNDLRSTAEMMAQVKRAGVKNYRILRRKEMLAILTHPEQADKIVQERVAEFNTLYRNKKRGNNG